MSELKDMTGKRFGRLIVIKYTGCKKWRCQCDCGSVVDVLGVLLRNGHTKSCGCLRKDVAHTSKTKHGKYHARVYRTWASIVQRCCNSNYKDFKNYGARGITMCDEWKNDFQAFYDWAISNGYNDSLTIDRIDNNKGYEPSNCRWATKKQQSRNRRNVKQYTINGEKHCLSEWCEIIGLNYNNVRQRVYKGWSIEKALELEAL